MADGEKKKRSYPGCFHGKEDQSRELQGDQCIGDPNWHLLSEIICVQSIFLAHRGAQLGFCKWSMVTCNS